jgi:anti-anti-sigma regulatory factor
MTEKDLESAALRIVLHKDPESWGELDTIQQYVYASSGLDVLLDFSAVEVFSSQMVIGLLLLDTLLRRLGHKLTLCSVGPSTRAAFEQLGVDHIFGLSRDAA